MLGTGYFFLIYRIWEKKEKSWILVSFDLQHLGKKEKSWLLVTFDLQYLGKL
jgi:hypothetical protein